MGAAAIRPDRGVTNFGRDKEVTRPPTDKRRLSSLSAGFCMLQNAGLPMEDLPSRYRAFENRPSYFLRPGRGNLYCLSNIWLRITNIFNPPQNISSTTGGHPHHATRH